MINHHQFDPTKWEAPAAPVVDRICIFCGSSTGSVDACEDCIDTKVGNGHHVRSTDDSFISFGA